MSNKTHIAIVVVTYNRHRDLLSCMNALLLQTLPPDEIIIVNNCSTDGTEAQLKAKGYIDLANPVETESGFEYSNTIQTDSGNTIRITYLDKKENDGGAGGFYAGMKSAYEKGFDWIVLMDDDGLPHRDEVKNLIETSKKHNLIFSNALVIDRDNHDQLAFNLFCVPKETSFFKNVEIVPECGAPFNGTLINRALIEKIGFIKKEMFIWGDDVEYSARARKTGHPLTTICSAHHFHPKTGKAANMIPFIKKWQYLQPSLKRAGIFYRNHCYIYRTYGTTKNLWKFMLRTVAGAIFNFQWQYIPHMVRSMKCGIQGDFKTKVD